jgi:pilus assembly protein FimV
MKFDFGDLKFDDAPPPSGPIVTAPVAPAMEDDFDADDPLARKLDLADEFRQIGDLEGARDLLQEVVNKADGTLKAKAQAMLDGLS